VVKFAGGRISQIVSLQDNTTRSEYQLEPQLVTNVSGPTARSAAWSSSRISRRCWCSVTSAEDKRFFQHSGFDPIRIVKAAYIDLKEGRNAQGASTLSSNWPRMFWLDTGKRWTRKLAEMIITLQLEQKLTRKRFSRITLTISTSAGAARSASMASAKRPRPTWGRISARSHCRRPRSSPA